MSISVVDVVKHPNELLVTIQGANVDEVTSSEGRRVAYDERGKHGFETAGMEPIGGAYPVDVAKLVKGAKADDAVLNTPVQMREISTRLKDLAYRHDYRFKRSI